MKSATTSLVADDRQAIANLLARDGNGHVLNDGRQA